MILIFKKYGTGEEIVRFIEAETAPIVGDTVSLDWTDKDHADRSYHGTVVCREMCYSQIAFCNQPCQKAILTVS